MLVVAVVSISLRCAARWYPELNTFREATMLACILATTYIVIAQVFRGGRVTSMRIQGALAIYMLFGLAWANAYELVDMSYHGIAFYTQEPMGSVSAWVYYSFVTLTTLGYGDVVPINRVARMLAIGEAMTGQIYLTVLVARLVALQVESRHEPDSVVGD